MRRLLPAIITIGLLLLAAPAAAVPAKATCSSAVKKANKGKCPPATTLPKAPPPPIFTQTGSGTAQTATFKAPNDWNLAWSYDCSGTFIKQGNFVVMSYDYYPNSASKPDFDNQGINQLGPAGNGVEHYHSGGNTKFFKVISECAWTITATKA